jgi:hypothetical protein
VELKLDNGIYVTLSKVNGGRLSTQIPVSSAKYLRKHPTKAKLVEHLAHPLYPGLIHTFKVADDYGSIYSFQIDDAIQPEVLKQLLNSEIYAILKKLGEDQ